MKEKLMVLMFIAINCTVSLAQDQPTIQDLNFLIGTWDVELDSYDTHDPESGIVFTEVGTMVCSLDLDYRGVKKFIFCRYDLNANSGRLEGRHRETLEVIQWSRFSNSFERTGVYSNWPSTGFETFQYDSVARKIYAEGHLGVQDGMEELYAGTYVFNDSFTAFERRNVANFSDMPITEYNLTMVSRATKR